MDASSVPAGRAEATRVQHPPPTPTKGTARIPPRSCREGQRTSSSWGRLLPTVRGCSQGQSQRLEGEPAEHQLRRMNPEVAERCLRQRTSGRRSLGDPEACLPDDGGSSDLDDRRTCCGAQRGVDLVDAKWFPGRPETARAVRSWCREFSIPGIVRRDTSP